MNTAAHTEQWKTDNDNQIVIDIETYANTEVMHLLPEPSIDSRLKDPAKVAEAKKEAKQKQADKMALSPLTGKIACIGWKSSVGEGVIFADNEKEILNEAYKLINGNQIITYNGKSFDIPFIFKRGIILGCEWATIKEMKLYTGRYDDKKHIDLMAEFCNYGEYEKLDTLARFILGTQKIEFDFKDIPELLPTEQGRAKIAEYCAKDVQITWDLAKRMGY